jgi:hypothetical protein
MAVRSNPSVFSEMNDHCAVIGPEQGWCEVRRSLRAQRLEHRQQRHPRCALRLTPVLRQAVILEPGQALPEQRVEQVGGTARVELAFSLEQPGTRTYRR